MESSELGNYADIIFFAILAIVIFVKLREVLGRQDDTQDRMMKRMSQQTQQQERKVVNLPNNTMKPSPKIVEPDADIDNPEVMQVLSDMHGIDPNFTPGTFLAGANMAFEMVIQAFQHGDRNTLKNLLSSSIYKDFIKEIEKQDKAEEHNETTLISVEGKIIDAKLTRSKASIVVEFTSEQINVTRGKEDEIVAGSASDIAVIKDEWEFERDMRSSNPNWMVVAT